MFPLNVELHGVPLVMPCARLGAYDWTSTQFVANIDFSVKRLPQAIVLAYLQAINLWRQVDEGELPFKRWSGTACLIFFSSGYRCVQFSIVNFYFS